MSTAHTAFMLPAAASIHASEINLKADERNMLAAKVALFLKAKDVPLLEIRTTYRKERYSFNTAISVVPARRAAVAAEKEAIELAVRELSRIEIEGVELKRSASEISLLLKKRGFKLGAVSVRRIAHSLSIELAE